VNALPLIALAAITLWPLALEANTCVAPKPLKVHGALCGRVIYPDGSSVPDAELRLLDQAGALAADARSDSKADFLFPPLVKGKYRLTTTSKGFSIAFGEIEITTSKTAVCKRPLTVSLGIGGCAGGVSRKGPPHN